MLVHSANVQQLHCPGNTALILCPHDVQKLVVEMGMELREYSWPDRWYLEKVGLQRDIVHIMAGLSLPSARLPHCCPLLHVSRMAICRPMLCRRGACWRRTTDEEIDKMHELFSRMFDEEYPPEDISAADWLKQQVEAFPYICWPNHHLPDALEAACDW